MIDLLERRPLLICVAGPNGAGKSTFFESHLAASGLRFVNADEIARELSIDAYRAADIAEQVRTQLVHRGDSFIFETVFSDPVGEKLAFLKEAEGSWLHRCVDVYRYRRHRHVASACLDSRSQGGP